MRPEFLKLLNCFNFTQHINFPTYIRGHFLGVVCSTCLSSIYLRPQSLSLVIESQVVFLAPFVHKLCLCTQNIFFSSYETDHSGVICKSDDCIRGGDGSAAVCVQLQMNGVKSRLYCLSTVMPRMNILSADL